MEVNLRELLSCSYFNKSEVLAGKRNLSNIVNSVTVLDSPDAPAYIKPGNLVITTAYSLLNDEAMQADVIKKLADAGASGLGIKLRFFNEKLPRNMLEIGEELNFPIISIPNEYAYTDIYDYVTNSLLSRVTKEVKRHDEVYKEINESIYEDGLMGIVKTLYKWTGLYSLIVFNQQKFSYPEIPLLEQIPLDRKKWQNKNILQKTIYHVNKYCYKYKDTEMEWLAIDIFEKGKEQGFILLLKGERDFCKDDFSLLEAASLTCGLEIKRIKSVLNIKRKYRMNFLAKLFKGEFTLEDATYAAKQLDYELPLAGTVAVVNFKLFTSINNEDLNIIENNILDIFGSDALFGLIDNNNIVILIANEIDKIQGLLEELYESFKDIYGLKNINIGIGRRATFATLADSCEEARTAIRIGECLNLYPKIHVFDKLGFYRLLKLPDIYDELVLYYEDYLKPLMSKETQKNDLLDTLINFIEHSYNYRDTAKIMFIHPNTVRYRISLIEKICRVNLKLPHDRLNMEIALKILPLLCYQKPLANKSVR